MSESDGSPAAPSASAGRDLFRHLLRVVNDPTAIGAFTARIVEAGDLTEFEITFGEGRIENVRTPGNPALLQRVIGGGRKAVEKRMSGRPNEVKEDAAALHAILVAEKVLPAEEIDECLSRLVSRCLLPLVASEAPEAEWHDDPGTCDQPLGLEFDPCFRSMFENGWRRGALGDLTPDGGTVLVAATNDWRGLPGPSGEACEVVFRLVDGVRSVDDIVRASGRDEAVVRYALARLEHAGYVRDFDATDLVAAAQKARREGRLDIALKYYRKAEERGGSAEASLESARIYEIMGLADEARAAFSRYADRCESGGKSADALRWFESAVASNPDDVDGRRRLATLRARSGQVDAAVAEWRSMAAESAKAGDFATAAACYRSILEHGGAVRDGELYDDFLEALRHEPDVKRVASDLRAMKRRHLEERDTDRALCAMETLRDIGEARPDERLDHANVLIGAGRLGDASAELEIVAAALRDRNPDAYGPDWDLLTGVYEMLVGFDSKHLDARLFLARDAAQSGRSEKAIEHYEAYLDALGAEPDAALFEPAIEEVLALDPSNARAVYAMADVKLAQGDLEGARSLLESHADAATSGGNADAARRLMERLLRLDPLHSAANAALAEAHALRGDRDAAAACRRRLASAHVSGRRFDEAERCLRDLVAQDASDPVPYMDLADLFDARQDRPSLVAVLSQCGVAALRAKNHGIVERTIRRLRALDPDDAAASELESALEAATRTPKPAPAAPAATAPAPAPPASRETEKRAPIAGAEVKPATKTGARHAPPVAPARTMKPSSSSPSSASPPVPAPPVPHLAPPEEEMRVIVPDDSPDDDPYTPPPSMVSAEIFGKILSAFRTVKSGDESESDDAAEGEDGDEEETLLVEEESDAPPAESESSEAPSSEPASVPAPAPAAAAKPARPAAQPTAPVPPEGDVEFSSILQSLKNLKLR